LAIVYKALASLHHPDKGSDGATMSLINQANDVLTKTAK
jgi:curved DNA-binding protein CbpA